jgi:hypothetical protein
MPGDFASPSSITSVSVVPGAISFTRMPSGPYVAAEVGTPQEPAPGPSREVRQSIADLLNRPPQAAAIVLPATYEVIARNDSRPPSWRTSPLSRPTTATSSGGLRRPPKWPNWSMNSSAGAGSSPRRGPRTT